MSNNLKDAGANSNTIRFNTPMMTGQGINGGLMFDLPLSAIASFQNHALDFAQHNSNRNQGFFMNVLGTSQRSIDNVANQFFVQQDKNNQFFSSLSAMFDKRTDQAIKSAEPKSGCFITTAWAETQGESFKDNCHELETLRAFRDGYMSETPERLAEVREYYENAPKFLVALEVGASNPSEYEEFLCHLSDEYIKPAVQQIENGEHFAARETYKNMYDFVAEVVSDLQGG